MAANPTDPSYDGIIVLGAPRSGTTLIRRLLNAHPNICCPPETNLLSAASRFLHEDRSVEGLTVGVLAGLAYSGYREDDVLARLRSFVFDFHREMAAKAGKTRWAEKTAFDAFHLDQIERLLDDSCRYVCVFRHGLDVVCSVQELCTTMDRYVLELHEYIRRYTSPYEAFAHAWADVNTRLLRFVAEHRDSCFALKYEELLDDPEQHLAQMFDFLEEPVSVGREILPAFGKGAEVGLGDWKTYETNALSRASTGRWKQLSDDTVARLAPIVNPVMQAIGYETIPAPKGCTPERARQNYRASKMVQQLKLDQLSPPIDR